MVEHWEADFEEGTGENEWNDFSESGGGHSPDWGNLTEAGCEATLVNWGYGGDWSMRCRIPANIAGNRAEGNRWAYAGNSGYENGTRFEYLDHLFIGRAIFLPEGFQVDGAKWCTIAQTNVRESVGGGNANMAALRYSSGGKIRVHRNLAPGHQLMYLSDDDWPLGEWLPMVWELLCQEVGHFKIWHGEDMVEGSPDGVYEADFDMGDPVQKSGRVQEGLYQAEFCVHEHIAYHDEMRVATTFAEAVPQSNGDPPPPPPPPLMETDRRLLLARGF